MFGHRVFGRGCLAHRGHHGFPGSYLPTKQPTSQPTNLPTDMWVDQPTVKPMVQPSSRFYVLVYVALALGKVQSSCRLLLRQFGRWPGDRGNRRFAGSSAAYLPYFWVITTGVKAKIGSYRSKSSQTFRAKFPPCLQQPYWFAPKLLWWMIQ